MRRQLPFGIRRWNNRKTRRWAVVVWIAENTRKLLISSKHEKAKSGVRHSVVCLRQCSLVGTRNLLTAKIELRVRDRPGAFSARFYNGTRCTDAAHNLVDYRNRAPRWDCRNILAPSVAQAISCVNRPHSPHNHYRFCSPLFLLATETKQSDVLCEFPPSMCFLRLSPLIIPSGCVLRSLLPFASEFDIGGPWWPTLFHRFVLLFVFRNRSMDVLCIEISTQKTHPVHKRLPDAHRSNYCISKPNFENLCWQYSRHETPPQKQISQQIQRESDIRSRSKGKGAIQGADQRTTEVWDGEMNAKTVKFENTIGKQGWRIGDSRYQGAGSVIGERANSR